MSKILINDPVALREAIEFAVEAKCIERFAIDLVRLLQTCTVGMTTENKRVAEISKDFAPHSFAFAIFDRAELRYTADSGRTRDNLVLAGGFIYAGPGAPGDGGFPSLTVNLSYVMGDLPTHSWSVHT